MRVITEGVNIFFAYPLDIYTPPMLDVSLNLPQTVYAIQMELL